MTFAAFVDFYQITKCCWLSQLMLFLFVDQIGSLSISHIIKYQSVCFLSVYMLASLSIGIFTSLFVSMSVCLPPSLSQFIFSGSFNDAFGAARSRVSDACPQFDCFCLDGCLVCPSIINCPRCFDVSR